VYYPPDYSYINFLQVNKDNVSSGQMSTNLRLNIYGVSLPPPNVDGSANPNCIVITFNSVYSILPTPAYSELLRLDYDMQNNINVLDIAKFIPMSGLNTYKNTEEYAIETILTLPEHVLKNAVKELGTLGPNNSGYNKKSIVDTLGVSIS
jgi:hypothetical protein